MDLGADDELVARMAFDGQAQGHLGAAPSVGVRGVEEVDAQVEAAPQDGLSGGCVGGAVDLAEGRALAQTGDAEIGCSEGDKIAVRFFRDWLAASRCG